MPWEKWTSENQVLGGIAADCSALAGQVFVGWKIFSGGKY